MGKIQHAFAHPNGWAGGLFALRVTRRGHFMFTGHDPMAAAIIVVPVENSVKFGSFHFFNVWICVCMGEMNYDSFINLLG